jgi:hypothetical protein
MKTMTGCWPRYCLAWTTCDTISSIALQQLISLLNSFGCQAPCHSVTRTQCGVWSAVIEFYQDLPNLWSRSRHIVSANTLVYRIGTSSNLLTRMARLKRISLGMVKRQPSTVIRCGSQIVPAGGAIISKQSSLAGA